LWKGKFVKLCVSVEHGVSLPRLCAAGCVWEDRLLVYGGDTSSLMIGSMKDDMCVLNFKNRTWSTCNRTTKGHFLTEHSSVEYNKRIYFFGGRSSDTRCTDRLLCYDIEQDKLEFIATTGDVPSGRSAHSAVVYKNEMYMFGGWDGHISHGDFYKLNMDTLVWSIVDSKGVPPCSRRMHSAVVLGDAMYLFGGFEEDHEPEYFYLLHEFNFVTKEWSLVDCKGTPPSGRSRMSVSVYENKLYVLGGWNRQIYFSDLYEFDFGSDTWTAIPSNFEKVGNGGIGQHVAVLYNNWLVVFSGYVPSELSTCRGDTFVMRLR